VNCSNHSPTSLPVYCACYLFFFFLFFLSFFLWRVHAQSPWERVPALPLVVEHGRVFRYCCTHLRRRSSRCPCRIPKRSTRSGRQVVQKAVNSRTNLTRACFLARPWVDFVRRLRRGYAGKDGFDRYCTTNATNAKYIDGQTPV